MAAMFITAIYLIMTDMPKKNIFWPSGPELRAVAMAVQEALKKG